MGSKKEGNFKTNEACGPCAKQRKPGDAATEAGQDAAGEFHPGFTCWLPGGISGHSLASPYNFSPASTPQKGHISVLQVLVPDSAYAQTGVSCWKCVSGLDEKGMKGKKQELGAETLPTSCKEKGPLRTKAQCDPPPEASQACQIGGAPQDQPPRGVHELPCFP